LIAFLRIVALRFCFRLKTADRYRHQPSNDHHIQVAVRNRRFYRLLIAALDFGCVTPALTGVCAGSSVQSPMAGYQFFGEGQDDEDTFLGNVGAAYTLIRKWGAEMFMV